MRLQGPGRKPVPDLQSPLRPTRPGAATPDYILLMHNDVAEPVGVIADSLDGAEALVAGNPVFEAGGTAEIRRLPRTE